MSKESRKSFSPETLWGLLAIFFYSLALFFITEAANSFQLVLNLSNLGNFYFATDSSLASAISITFGVSFSLFFALLIWEYSSFSLFQFIHDVFIVFNALPIALLATVSSATPFVILLYFPILALYLNQFIPENSQQIPLISLLPLANAAAVFISLSLFFAPYGFFLNSDLAYPIISMTLIAMVLVFQCREIEKSITPKLWLSSSLLWASCNAAIYSTASHFPTKIRVFAGSTHLFFQNSILFLFLLGLSVLLIGVYIQLFKDETNASPKCSTSDLSRVFPSETKPYVDPFAALDQIALFDYLISAIKENIRPGDSKNFFWIERLRIALFLQKKAFSTSTSVGITLGEVERETVKMKHPLLTPFKENENLGFSIKKPFSIGSIFLNPNAK